MIETGPNVVAAQGEPLPASRPNAQTLVVGLTGGVASGKSHVHALFAAHGVPVLEADDVGRAVVMPGEPALGAVFATFGAHLRQADGSLDRAALRAVVFSDPAALARLEAITHPAIRARIQGWIAGQTAPYCLLSAAILLERRLAALCHRVLVVDAPEADQMDRLQRRDGIAMELAQAMLARQLSRAERLARADDVIANPDPPGDLTASVSELHRRYSEGLIRKA